MGQYAVFGLGYVGSTMLGALAAQGHPVIGLDPDAAKRKIIEGGGSPVGEPGIEERIADGRARGLIQVTGDVRGALSQSTLAFVCVGTPSNPDGTIDLGSIDRVTREIAAALRGESTKIGIVYRSTMIPGTIEQSVLPILEAAIPGGEEKHYEVACYPEFLREGNAWDDYLHPPKVVVGARTPWIRDRLSATFPAIPAPVFWTDFRTAEMIKYVDNAFHATKVTFANEIGILAREFGVDPIELVRIFLSDRKLNVSEAYLRPGFAFGGSCLGKDLRALHAWARKREVPSDFLAGILGSNQHQIQRVVAQIRSKAGEGTIGFLGLAFKPGTDDLRESQFLAVASECLRQGARIRAHDPNVRWERLTGANLHHVEATLPTLRDVFTSSCEELWRSCAVVVLGRGSEWGTDDMVRDFVRRGGFVVDLVRTQAVRILCGDNYWSVV